MKRRWTDCPKRAATDNGLLRDADQAGAAAAPQHLYLLDGELAAPELDQLTGDLLHDPVVQQAEWHTLPQLDSAPGAAAEVAFKPGVTDNEAESILIGARRLGIGLKSRLLVDDGQQHRQRYAPAAAGGLRQNPPRQQRAARPPYAGPK